MHSKHIMHRDLKPENILFRKPMSSIIFMNYYNILYVCIADFGLAQNADKFPYLFNRCGTPGVVAPEVINCKDGGGYDTICDIYSLGLIFYILLTGKPAFPGKCYNDVLAKNRKCEISFGGALFEKVSQQAYGLLRKMLEKDPHKRITTQQALEHPYFGRKFQQVEENDDITLKVQEEHLKFDKQRLKQLSNSPLHSSLITASSKLRKSIYYFHKVIENLLKQKIKQRIIEFLSQKIISWLKRLIFQQYFEQDQRHNFCRKFKQQYKNESKAISQQISISYYTLKLNNINNSIIKIIRHQQSQQKGHYYMNLQN